MLDRAKMLPRASMLALPLAAATAQRSTQDARGSSAARAQPQPPREIPAQGAHLVPPPGPPLAADERKYPSPVADERKYQDAVPRTRNHRHRMLRLRTSRAWQIRDYITKAGRKGFAKSTSSPFAREYARNDEAIVQVISDFVQGHNPDYIGDITPGNIVECFEPCYAALASFLAMLTDRSPNQVGGRERQLSPQRLRCRVADRSCGAEAATQPHH